jgi:thiamine-phosphate pyrophosphorylase
MDQKLLSWARAVKARTRPPHPVLWLFTDSCRLPDPLPAIARLPPGLAGVVFRHDDAPNRAALGRRIAALCRAKRLALTVSGDWRLAAELHAGTHLRRAKGRPAPATLNTASVHSAAELVRARHRGLLPVLSPAFPTQSHPGAVGLNPWRWSRLAGHHGAVALGGVTGRNVARLGPSCRGAGAIGALSGATKTHPSTHSIGLPSPLPIERLRGSVASPLWKSGTGGHK